MRIPSLRLAACATAAALALPLAACDRNKGATPPTPSTATGTHKGVMQSDKEGLQVRDPTTSSSGMATTPGNSTPGVGGTVGSGDAPRSAAASAVAPTLPGGGLPQPASGADR